MSNIDTLKAVACCAATCVGTLAWLLFSGQKLVPRTVQSVARVVTRITLVHLVLVPLLAIGGGIPINYLAVPLLVMLIFTPLVTLNSMGSLVGDVPGLAIVFVLVVPLYAIKQFVLGFPDRDEFVLQPEARVGVRAELLSEFVGHSAAVIAPLKPFGYIELKGQKLSAKSEDGSLIDAGSFVLICDQRDQTLMVRPASLRSASDANPEIDPR